MALYKTHAKFNILFALPVLIILIYIIFHPKISFLIIFTSSFIYSTLFMSPDVDLTNKIKLFSLKGMLTIPFRIYSKIFKHRGLSHSLIFGTITRIVFLFFLFLIILFLINQSIPSHDSFITFFKIHKKYTLYCFSGIFLADTCHLILDFK